MEIRIEGQTVATFEWDDWNEARAEVARLGHSLADPRVEILDGAAALLAAAAPTLRGDAAVDTAVAAPRDASEALQRAWEGIEANSRLAPTVTSANRAGGIVDRDTTRRRIAAQYVEMWPQWLRLDDDKLIVAI